MICKRCGTSCDDADRFCRTCGRKIRTAPLFSASARAQSSAEPAPGEIVPLPPKKKWILFLSVGLLLLAATFSLFLLPAVRQSFLSPAAYYLESEAREIDKLSSHLVSLSSPLYSKQAKSVSGLLRAETEGEAYAELEPYLDQLRIQAQWNTDSKDHHSLSLAGSYQDEIFCRLLALAVSDRISVSFPELSDGQVVTKVSSLLSDLLNSSDDTLKSLTGLNRQELSAWFTSYLEPILLSALEESEQTLDFAVVDGIEVSTVTFTLSEELLREVLKSAASSLRRDTTLPVILKNLSEFVTASADFRRDFAAEFNLTEEDLAAFPALGTLADSLPEYNEPEEGSLLALINSIPEEDAIRDYVDRLADRLAEFADEAPIAEGLSLTAYYQGTDLIGRSLHSGTQTVFEAFRYRRDAEIILDVRLEISGQIYHFSHIDSSDNSNAEHKFSLTRRTADAESTAPSTGEETLFELDLCYQQNATVGGVSAFLGEVRLTCGTTQHVLSNETILDDQTRLSYEYRTVSSEGGENRFKIRAQLTYSPASGTENLSVKGSSDFGTPAFSELLLNLKRNLQETDLFERLFGEGSLSTFLAEEEARSRAARQEAAENGSLPEEQIAEIEDAENADDPREPDADKTEEVKKTLFLFPMRTAD